MFLFVSGTKVSLRYKVAIDWLFSDHESRIYVDVWASVLDKARLKAN